MGQTSSSGQVDYTFGIVANNSNSAKTSTTTSKEEDNVDIPTTTAFSTWTANERLLQHPQHYGLENDSSTAGYDSDDELGGGSPSGNRLSIPSTSSTFSLPLSYQQRHQSPFLFRTSTSPFRHEEEEKQTIDRIDSGYADQDDFGPKKGTTTATLISNLLAMDIRYVDKIYYSTDTDTNNRKESHQHHHHQQRHEFNLFTTTNDNAIHTTTLDSAADHRDDNHDAAVDITIGTKLTFAAAALASQDPTMRDICLSLRSLIHLSPNIGLLTSLRKLNLCNNMLTVLPDSIGQLKQLEVLTISKNQLQHLPDSIQYLPRLTELDLSYNQLHHLPSLSHLTSLCTLLLSHNQLTRLPTDLIGMKCLVTMDLTHNPLLSVLPVEITRLSNLRRLRLDHCQKLLNMDEHVRMEQDLAHDPPSLMEICARKVLLSLSSSMVSNSNRRTRISGTTTPSSSSSSMMTAAKLDQLTGPLLSYLASANTCSSCHGPYFESHVIRRRLIEKNDLWIPLEYILCSAHWSDETDRLLNMFHCENLSLSGDDSSNNGMVNAIASLQHTLAAQQQQQQLSLSTSLCMDMDELDTKPTGKMAFLWRHPQRLQRVRNKYPSSFLIPKIHRG